MGPVAQEFLLQNYGIIMKYELSWYGIVMSYEPRNIDALNAAVVPKLLQNSKSSLFSEKMHFGE